MRLALAFLAGAATASLSALILGEYELVGWTPYVAGVLLGLAIAEVVVSLAKRRDLVVAVPVAALAAGSMVWAAWISSGRDWAYVSSWAGVVVAPLAAFAWAFKTPGR